jgi:hypothetical protein
MDVRPVVSRMRVMKRWIVLLCLLLPAAALADVDIAVGDSREVDVGVARGVVCDDLSIVSAEMTTAPDTQTNKVTFKGLKVGRTECRVGNVALGSPTMLIRVSVHLPLPKP